MADDVLQLISNIKEKSSYKEKKLPERKWMSVPEMGKMLGLKKTDRYWLVHKNFFETEVIDGTMRVNIESFEKWYANQVKYHKITGEEPGEELKARSYSPQDIAQMLGISDSVVYDIMKRNNIEFIIVDYWKRIPRDVFWNWYNSQDHYRTAEDRGKPSKIELETLSIPEMDKLLGIEAGTGYLIINNEKYRDIFEIVRTASGKRITKSSFEKFLNVQQKYKLKEAEVSKQKKKPKPSRPRKDIGDKKYLTIDEAAFLAGVSRSFIYTWFQIESFPYVYVQNNIRIKRKAFEDWLKNRA